MNQLLKKIIIFIALIILSYLLFIVQSTIGFVLLALLFFYVAVKLLKAINVTGLTELGIFRHEKWGFLLCSGTLIGCFFNIVVYLLLSHLSIISIEHTSFHKVALIILFAFVTTSFTAVAEELIFRGYLVRVLKGHLSWKWIILIISILFY